MKFIDGIINAIERGVQEIFPRYETNVHLQRRKEQAIERLEKSEVELARSLFRLGEARARLAIVQAQYGGDKSGTLNRIDENRLKQEAIEEYSRSRLEDHIPFILQGIEHAALTAATKVNYNEAMYKYAL